MRERDRERFLATLFAPADKRRHLFALYALDLEIANIPDAVREPMAGEIRLQWWREVLAGQRTEEAMASPVAAALLDTVARCDVPIPALRAVADARQFDLTGEPMGSEEELGRYIDATSAAILDIAASVLDRSWQVPQASHAAGRVLGVTKVIRNLARDIANGRMFLPLDLLAAHGVHTASVLGGEMSDGLRGAIAELRKTARMELAHLRDLPLPSSVLPAFLPLTLTPLYLARTEKAGYDPFRSDPAVSGLRTQFALWRAARSGRI